MNKKSYKNRKIEKCNAYELWNGKRNQQNLSAESIHDKCIEQCRNYGSKTFGMKDNSNNIMLING